MVIWLYALLLHLLRMITSTLGSSEKFYKSTLVYLGTTVLFLRITFNSPFFNLFFLERDFQPSWIISPSKIIILHRRNNTFFPLKSFNLFFWIWEFIYDYNQIILISGPPIFALMFLREKIKACIYLIMLLNIWSFFSDGVSNILLLSVKDPLFWTFSI